MELVFLQSVNLGVAKAMGS